MDLCPLTEFVYHAALKASGKKFRRVYEGILGLLVRSLCKEADVEGCCKVLEYTEKSFNVTEYSNKGSKKKEEERERHDEVEEDELDWGGVEEMLEGAMAAKVEIKVEEAEEGAEARKRTKVLEKCYDCQMCGHKFKSRIRLYKHQLQQHPEREEEWVEKPLLLVRQDQKVKNENCESMGEKDLDLGISGFQCKACLKPFMRLMILINHCRREHPDQPEICPEEPLKLGLLETLHERIQDDQGTFKCGLDLCNHSFDRFLSLVDHERTHTEAFICILCGNCCQNPENLIHHMDSNHGSKSEFVCRVCGFFTRKADSLRTHVQQEHMAGSVTYQFDECEYNTEKKQSLHNHKRVAHKTSSHYCDICGKSYSSGASLYVHKKSHDPDFKKFKCSLCPAKFAYSSGLSYHMAVHTGEKPFSCAQCGSNFGSHTALSRHTRVLHAEEKDMKFQCEHCLKRFPSRMKREYEDHTKTHTGERDHICQICGSAYFSRKMLRKHELKKHSNILPKKADPVRIDPDSVPSLTVTHKANGFNY